MYTVIKEPKVNNLKYQGYCSHHVNDTEALNCSHYVDEIQAPYCSHYVNDSTIRSDVFPIICHSSSHLMTIH